MNNYKIPKALICKQVQFNPYQYLPFEKIMKWNEYEKFWEWNHHNVLIADEVGVGKTFETGIILKELLANDENLTVLIVCPVKLCENWCEELSAKFGLDVVNYKKSHIPGQITIVPYSFFDSDKAMKELDPYDVLILDEAHYLRNGGKKWNYIENLIET